MAKSLRLILPAIISGFLLVAATFQNFRFCLWVAFLPLLWSVFTNREKFKTGLFFVPGFITGFIYFGYTVRWFFAANPAQVMGLSPALSIASITFFWFWTTLAFAIPWGLLSLLISTLKNGFKSEGNRVDRVLNFLFITSAFLVFEYIRSSLLGLFWWGPGSVWGAHWTIGNLAYLLTDSKIVGGVAPLTGIYGVIAVVIFINYLIYVLLSKNKSKNKISIKNILPVAIIGLMAYLSWPMSNNQVGTEKGKSINFVAVQTEEPSRIEFTQTEKLEMFNKQLELINKIKTFSPNADLVVLPETIGFMRNLATFLSPDEMQKYFAKIFPSRDALIITSTRFTGGDGKDYSRVLYINSREGFSGYYDKRILTPGGEFIPYILKLPIKILSPKTLVSFKTTREYSPGENIKTNSINFNNLFSVGSAVCSDFISPDFIRGIAKTSDVIAGLSSAGVFNGSDAILGQARAYAQLRAVENGIPIITSANMGTSFVVNNKGQIIKDNKNRGSELLTGSIYLPNKKTWYNLLGDWILIPAFFVIIFYILRKQKLHDRPN